MAKRNRRSGRLSREVTFGPSTHNADAFSHETYAAAEFSQAETVSSEFDMSGNRAKLPAHVSDRKNEKETR